jgi:transcriptional regulator with XRE-family HTH domain
VYKKNNTRSTGGTRSRKRYPEARADAESIAALLRDLDEARARAKLTKEALAEKARLPAPTVRLLLTSPKASPSLRTLTRLARALGLRVSLIEESRPVTGKGPETTASSPADGRG